MRETLALENRHDDAAILSLSLRRLVVGELFADAHRGRHEDVRWRYGAFLDEGRGHRLGPPRAQRVVEGPGADGRRIALDLDPVGIDALGFRGELLELRCVLGGNLRASVL